MSETATFTITRNNFKNMRSAYGISIKEISEKCGLSDATVRAFESNDNSYTGTYARDYNERNMCRKLEEMIQLKSDAMFEPKTKKVKTDRQERMLKARETRIENGIDRKLFISVIKTYCAREHISLTEFCQMCGMSASTLSPNVLKKFPVVYSSTVDKVLAATGWSKDVFEKGSDIPQEEKKVEDPVVKPVESKSNVKYNRKLLAEDGKYYIEYDIYVPQHKREEITLEEFIKEAQKC